MFESQHSCLIYLAAHAPETPQAWFTPRMGEHGPRPANLWTGESGRVYPDRFAAEKAEGDDGYYNANSEAQFAWDQEFAKEKLIQWPYAWARAVFATRGGA